MVSAESRPFRAWLALLLFFPLPAIFAGALFLFLRVCDISATGKRFVLGAGAFLSVLMLYKGLVPLQYIYYYTSIFQLHRIIIKSKGLVIPWFFSYANLFLMFVILGVVYVCEYIAQVKVPEQIKREIREKERDTLPVDVSKLISKVSGKNYNPADGVLLGVTRGKKPFYITAGELNKHAALIGTTGSGKTTTIYRFIDYTLKSGQAGVIIDGKGDPDFRHTIQRLAASYDRDISFFSMDINDGLSSYNPFSVGTPSELTDKIIALTDWSEEHYKLSSQRFLQLLFRSFEKLNIKPDLGIITKYCNIERLVNELCTVQAATTNSQGGELSDFDPLAAAVAPPITQPTPTTDPEITDIIESLHTIDEKAVMGIASRLGVMSEGDMRGLMGGSSGLEISNILERRGIVVFSLDSLRWPEQARLMGRLVINDLKACIAEHQRLRRGQRVSLIFDEFNVFASSSVVDLINKSRSAGFEALLAFQSLADIAVLDHGEEIKNQIIQNCNTLIVQRQNSAKDAEELAATFGTKDGYALTIQTGEGGSTGMGSTHSVKEFVYHPDEIKRLQTGEALIKRNIKGVNHERVFILPLEV